MKDNDDFEEMTKYLTTEARWFALDSMACAFHNNGYSLQGNTEENDALWMARYLRERLEHGARWDTASEERKKELLAIAEVAISCLPGLAERISSRYIRMASAIRLMEKVAREQAQSMKEKKRRQR